MSPRFFFNEVGRSDTVNVNNRDIVPPYYDTFILISQADRDKIPAKVKVKKKKGVIGPNSL